MFLLLFALNNCFAQSDKESFYAFKADWSPASSIESCTYFMYELKQSDTQYVCRYYNKLGPMIKQETYYDAQLSTPNGFFCWYNKKGKIDSSGWIKNFKKNGRWDYYKDSFYMEYDNGIFIKQGSYNHKADSVLQEKDSTEKEAVFPNGVKGWSKYLQKNLQTPDRLAKNFPSGVYAVTVCFVVNKQGYISDVYLRQSVEWSADTEVFRIIEKGPLWQPAIQKGKPVLYRQLQNVSFQISK